MLEVHRRGKVRQGAQELQPVLCRGRDRGTCADAAVHFRGPAHRPPSGCAGDSDSAHRELCAGPGLRRNPHHHDAGGHGLHLPGQRGESVLSGRARDDGGQCDAGRAGGRRVARRPAGHGAGHLRKLSGGPAGGAGLLPPQGQAAGFRKAGAFPRGAGTDRQDRHAQRGEPRVLQRRQRAFEHDALCQHGRDGCFRIFRAVYPGLVRQRARHGNHLRGLHLCRNLLRRAEQVVAEADLPDRLQVRHDPRLRHGRGDLHCSALAGGPHPEGGC